MRERFDREFRALLNPDNPNTRSIWTYIARLLQQFGLKDYGITIDEVLSEVYSRGIRRLVDLEKPIENPLGWIRLTAFNVVREMERNQNRCVPLDAYTYIEFELIPNEPTDVLVAGEAIEDNIRALYAALQRLTNEEQKILYWRIIHDQTWCEVAECLMRNGGKVKSEATLRQQGCRALSRLRRLFHELKSQDQCIAK